MKIINLFLLFVMTSKVMFAQPTEKEGLLKSDFIFFELNEEKANEFNKKAIVAYDNENYELAGEYYIKAYRYKRDADSPFLYNALVSFKQANKLDKTIRCYEALLKYGINLLEKQTQLSIYTILASIYDQQNKPNQAINCVNLGLEIKPNDANLISLKANSYYKIGDNFNFIKTLKKLHTTDPKNFEANYNLGFLYAEKNDFKQAKYYYENALRIDKHSESANFNYACLLIAQEKEIVNKMNNAGHSKNEIKKYDSLKKEREKIHKSAIPYLKKAIKINKKNTEAIKALINIYSLLNNHKKTTKMKAQLEASVSQKI